jgi:hypothetical protein
MATPLSGSPPLSSQFLPPPPSQPSGFHRPLHSRVSRAKLGCRCAACHVGGFGPQLAPFGIDFRANGYTLRGGTGIWAHELLNLVISPSYQADATALPAGYGTNNFFNALGTATALYVAGGTPLGDGFGIGGFEQLGLSYVPGGPLIASEATSDLKATKRLSLGDHSLMLGFDFTNTPSGGDPYNSLYNGFATRSSAG